MDTLTHGSQYTRKVQLFRSVLICWGISFLIGVAVRMTCLLTNDVGDAVSLPVTWQMMLAYTVHLPHAHTQRGHLKFKWNSVVRRSTDESAGPAHQMWGSQPTSLQAQTIRCEALNRRVCCPRPSNVRRSTDEFAAPDHQMWGAQPTSLLGPDHQMCGCSNQNRIIKTSNELIENNFI